MRLFTVGLISLALTSAVHAKERKIVDPLAPDIVANNHVISVEVRLSPTVVEKMAAFDKKAADKRVEAKLPPFADASASQGSQLPSSQLAADSANAQTTSAEVTQSTPIQPEKSRPAKDEYATLPFANMFPLVLEDVTHEWGLINGRAVKLVVTVDTLKTADAAMAILIAASSDQLAGMVEVRDAATDAALGSFYVDVINSHGGWLGMAMRGSGVREKLAEEFALQTSRVLTGRKSKKAKKAQA